MHSVPLINEAAKVRRSEGNKVCISVPLRHRGWSLALRRVLPLSDVRNVELDRVGAEVLALCDGRRSVEDIIDAHMEAWQLSFFEARGMIFHFLKQLMKRGVVVLVAPKPPA